MKILNKIIVFLVIVLIVLQGINIFLENRISLESIKSSKLRKEIAIVQERNELLNSQVVQYSSFDMISSRAAELGFVEAKEAISLFAPVPLAIKK